MASGSGRKYDVPAASETVCNRASSSTTVSSTREESSGKSIDYLNKLKRSTIAYRGHMTRIYMDIETLLISSANYEEVISKRKDLDRIFCNVFLFI